MTTGEAHGALLLPSLPGALTVRLRSVVADGAALAVAELGDPQAPAWVLAHGIGSSARFVAAAFAEPVIRSGQRLVVYDLRGHGASSTAPRLAQHHLDVHAADLSAVVTSVEGTIEVVGGVSLGAHAAVRAVGCGTGARMVVACLPAWIGLAVAGRGPHAAVAARIAAEGIAPTIADLERDDALAAWLRATLLTDYRRHDPASLEAALRSLDGAEAPSVGELQALHLPLAVLGWPDDPGHPLAVARRWAGLAPQGTLSTLTIASLEAGVSQLGAAAVRATGSVRRAGSRR